MNVLKGLVGLQITDVDHKWVRAVVFAIDNQLGHHNSMVRRSTEGSNPPFGGSQGGRMDHKGLVRGIPCSGGLETADIRAMTQFSLSIAANDFVPLGTFEEEFMLLRGALFSEGNLDNVLR